MDDNDAFEAKLEAEPEAGGGLEANDDYNEVEIDAEPRRLDINPDTVLAAGEQSVVQVQTCEQCLKPLLPLSPAAVYDYTIQIYLTFLSNFALYWDTCIHQSNIAYTSASRNL